MQGWLLGAYVEVVAIKVVGYLMVKETRNGSSHFMTCYIICFLGVLFPFLIAWTILGTLWYVQSVSASCVIVPQLPKEEEPWLVVMVLITLYVLLLLFLVLIFSTGVRFAVWRRHVADGNRPLVVPGVDPPYEDDEERPMNATELRQLDRYISPYNAPSDTSTCTICYEDFKVIFPQKREKLVRLPQCGHCFHPLCIKDWLKIKSLCPYCKGDVLAAMR